MAVVLMSEAELSRVDTLARVDRGELPAAEAASLLGLSGGRSSACSPGSAGVTHEISRRSASP